MVVGVESGMCNLGGAGKVAASRSDVLSGSVGAVCGQCGAAFGSARGARNAVL